MEMLGNGMFVSCGEIGLFLYALAFSQGFYTARELLSQLKKDLIKKKF